MDRRSRALGLLFGGLAVTVPLAATVGERDANAVNVERIVAVVDDQPILLTELRQRARPFLLKIYANVPEESRKVAEAEMYKELLGKLVDERLVAIAATKLTPPVEVKTKEVDDAVKLKAADLNVAIADLLSEAAKQGLSEADYRDEVRREILFGKMLETRVRSRVRVTEDDVNEYYRRIVVQERRGQTYRASVIVLDLPTGEKGEARRAFADSLVKLARGGADFADLAKKYSVDPSRDKGGDLGTRNPDSFGKGVDDAILRLNIGQVSEPLVLGSTLMIVKVTERPKSSVPPLDDVHDVIVARVRDEQLQKQIKVWLDELKTGLYIEVRL